MGKGMGIRIGATVGIAAALLKTWQVYRGSGNFGNDIVVNWTGYNPDSGNFDIKQASALIPLLAGVGVSFAASKIGLNRYTPKGINI